MMREHDILNHLELGDRNMLRTVAELRKALDHVERAVQAGEPVFPQTYLIERAVEIHAAARVHDLLLAYREAEKAP